MTVNQESNLETTILIVDDEEMTRRLLRLMLERDGYRIVEAEDGIQALARIEETVPDVIILDVMMPNMDGFATCEVLRERPDTADLPIIMLSARTQLEAVRAGLQAGANRYMTKPVSKPELIQTIDELISSSPVESNGYVGGNVS